MLFVLHGLGPIENIPRTKHFAEGWIIPAHSIHAAEGPAGGLQCYHAGSTIPLPWAWLPPVEEDG